MSPEAALVQRREALRRANEVRTYRRQVKFELGAGIRDIDAVIAGRDPVLASMRVEALLLAAPRLGRAKVARLLRMCGLSTFTTMEALTPRQRGLLLVELRSQRNRYLERKERESYGR